MPCPLPSSLPPSNAIFEPSFERAGAPSKSFVVGSITGSLPSGVVDQTWKNGVHVAPKYTREPSGDQAGNSAPHSPPQHEAGSGAEVRLVSARAPVLPSEIGRASCRERVRVGVVRGGVR